MNPEGHSVAKLTIKIIIILVCINYANNFYGRFMRIEFKK